MKKKKKTPKIHISDKELDRDIINLSLPEPDMSIEENGIDDLPFYSDEFKAQQKARRVKPSDSDCE
jgi:hypothetical protein